MMIYLDNAATSLQKPKEVEEAMIHANRKFKLRFSFIEKSVNEGRGRFDDYTIDELEQLWQQAKERED